MLARWLPALRMARRDMRRHPLRTTLVGLLVAVPVLGATFGAQLAHAASGRGEQLAHHLMGGADGLVTVTRSPQVRVTYYGGGSAMGTHPVRFTRNEKGRRVPVRRPRSAVSLPSLLPAGTHITPAPAEGGTELASGGNAGVLFLDLTDPMAEGIAWVDQGRAPTAPDQVAMPRAMADELGLLDASGSLRPDATLRLADGRPLSVVGLGYAAEWGTNAAARLIAPPHSVLRRQAPHRFLVDLPGPATLALVHDLAAHGVAMEPRDVVFHPRAWHAVPVMGPPVDPRQVAVAMMLFVLALAEVCLLVGSAFAVGARRQVRDLGLLASSGGAPSDVRRVVLAQGVLLGLGATAVGLAAGVGLFLLAGDALWYAVMRERLWSDVIAWRWLVGIGVLGSLTGLAAAGLPAWSVGRLTPVTALSGRFPVRPGESRAHLPAFLLAGCGAAVLASTGFWTAAEYAPQHGPGYHQPSTSPVLLGCLGLLMLLAGVVWSAPYVVRRLAAIGRHLPLSARFAFRDAARHRFRTAAAGAALTVTVASGVFVGFVLQSVVTSAAARTRIPPQTVSVYLPADPSDAGGSSPEQVRRVEDTLGDVLGPVRTTVIWAVFPSGDGHGASEVGIRLGRNSYMNVSAVDTSTLRRILGPGHEAAVRAFASGGVVTHGAKLVHDGSVTLANFTDPQHPVKLWTLPGVDVARLPAGYRGLAGGWISLSTAHGLGLSTVPENVEVHTDHLVTNDDLTRLAVHGINAWSQDPQLSSVTWIRFAVLGLVALLTLVVAGIAVALAAAEGRGDTATMAAIGAGPWRRRGLGAMHGLFLGVVGGVLGVLVGLPSAASLLQADGLPGIAVPWLVIAAALLVVPLLGAAAGWVVTPTRLPLVRRTG